MAHAQTSPIGRFLRHLSVAHLVAAASDDELVERFAVHRDEATFTALVRRHGPLVLGVCRRVLTDPHAAEDCFQETFLVLARRAGSLSRPGALGPWLYGVATRTALKARARATRRLRCERRAGVAEAVAVPDELAWRDLRPKLDAAIAGLSPKYRDPFVLHHLEGLSVAEVARRLGCPPGTVAARLARAKERLRTRLAPQGLAWCTGALAAALAQGAASASVPAPLAAGTVQAALQIAAGKAAAAAALITGGLSVMSVSKAKVAWAILLMGGAFGVGVGVGIHSDTGPVGNIRLDKNTLDQSRPSTSPAALLERRAFRGAGQEPRFETVPGTQLQRDSVSCREPSRPDQAPGGGVTSGAGLVGSIVRNEKNLDILPAPSDNPGCARSIKANEPVHRGEFLDTGTVQRTASRHDYSVTAGAGLRIVVPMLGPAPIAVDFPFPTVKWPEAPELLFSFWIGFFS